MVFAVLWINNTLCTKSGELFCSGKHSCFVCCLKMNFDDVVLELLSPLPPLFEGLILLIMLIDFWLNVLLLLKWLQYIITLEIFFLIQIFMLNANNYKSLLMFTSKFLYIFFLWWRNNHKTFSENSAWFLKIIFLNVS